MVIRASIEGLEIFHNANGFKKADFYVMNIFPKILRLLPQMATCWTFCRLALFLNELEFTLSKVRILQQKKV